MRRILLATCCAAICGLLSTSALGTVTIDVGTILLQPNTPNQQFRIDVSGGGQVNGVKLEVQVADGRPPIGFDGDVPIFGPATGPAITNVDLVTGTIFAGNNNGQAGSGAMTTQIYEAVALTSSGLVAASGLLATVTVDTTGFTTDGQTFDLKLTGTLNGDTDFYFTSSITNGTLQIQVPEPAGLGLLAAASCLLLRRNRRYAAR